MYNFEIEKGKKIMTENTIFRDLEKGNVFIKGNMLGMCIEETEGDSCNAINLLTGERLIFDFDEHVEVVKVEINIID